MPKLKTNRAAAKRFRISKRGKVKAKNSHLRHLLTCSKNRKRKRRLRKAMYLDSTNLRQVRRLLPYAGVARKTR